MNDEAKKQRAADAQRRYRARLAEDAEQLERNLESRREAQRRYREKKSAQSERQYSFFLTEDLHKKVLAFIQAEKKLAGV